MPTQETLIKFHFINNNNEDFVKKMPIHTLKVWAHKFAMVVLMLKDPRKKQVINLIYSVDKISNEVTFTNVEKRFKFKDMKAKIVQDIFLSLGQVFKSFLN